MFRFSKTAAAFCMATALLFAGCGESDLDKFNDASSESKKEAEKRKYDEQYPKTTPTVSDEDSGERQNQIATYQKLAEEEQRQLLGAPCNQLRLLATAKIPGLNGREEEGAPGSVGESVVGQVFNRDSKDTVLVKNKVKNCLAEAQTSNDDESTQYLAKLLEMLARG